MGIIRAYCKGLAKIAGLTVLVLVLSATALPRPVRAQADYDNAAIADSALTYWSGSNSDGRRSAGARACADAHKPGDSGGECRAFVNCIVWMASGHTQNLGGDYYQAFTQAGGVEITNVAALTKGDIVQFPAARLHTLIIVAAQGNNQYMVVDSNHWGDQTVGVYTRIVSLDSGTRAFRMGRVSGGNDSAPNRPPYGALDTAVRVAGGIRVTGWAIDPDTRQPIKVHVYGGTGTASAGNPAVATVADQSRADVDHVYHAGVDHGFATTVGLDGGSSQQVCAYGINTPVGSNPRLGCRTVSVR